VRCSEQRIGRIAIMGETISARSDRMKKPITTTREDDDRAIRYIEVVITGRGMVEGQLQHDLLTLVIQHIRNTRALVERLREELVSK
jgi:hypothetical protein